MIANGDPEVLAGEYAEVAARLDQLTAAVASTTRERNAVLAAMATSMTYEQMTAATGLAAWRIRTALHNHWKDNRPGKANPDDDDADLC